MADQNGDQLTRKGMINTFVLAIVVIAAIILFIIFGDEPGRLL